MALSGLNVTFGWIIASPPEAAGAPAGYSPSAAPIYGPSSDSQLMAAAATSTKVATRGANPTYLPCVSIISSADAWVTIGAAPPDPSVDQPTGGRRFIPAYNPSGGAAFQSIDIFCAVGDKVRWALA